jgi:hypothetical protein
VDSVVVVAEVDIAIATRVIRDHPAQRRPKFAAAHAKNTGRQLDTNPSFFPASPFPSIATADQQRPVPNNQP